jgi:hypothetical protein
MCAGAFTYLNAIDDSSYRDEVVYPRDLVDYACSLKNDLNAEQAELQQLRVVAGNPCIRAGFWLTPARAGSRTQFSEGEMMPAVENADYGITIWQWADRQ